MRSVLSPPFPRIPVAPRGIHKRAVVTFRGSKSPFSNRDRRTNLNAMPSTLLTPDKIAHRMRGRLRERVLVHRGFRNYLFRNRFVKGDQPYDPAAR